MTRASRITKRIQVATLAVLAAILFFWPFFDPISSLLDTAQIVGILTAVMAGVVLYFDERIAQVIRGPSGVLSHGALGECLNEALKDRKSVERLRVMATSSEVIEALIQSSSIRIGRCDLLLRRYPDSTDSYNGRVDHTIGEWESMKTARRIDTLDIARYDSLPSEYQIIVDDDAVIFGAYVYSPDQRAEADFRRPSLIQTASSSEARAVIGSVIAAFDENHAAWKEAEARRDSATAK